MKAVSDGYKYYEEKSAVESDRVAKWATSERVIREDLQEEVTFRLPDDKRGRFKAKSWKQSVPEGEEHKQKPGGENKLGLFDVQEGGQHGCGPVDEEQSTWT